ncbi:MULTISPECIES: RNA polymerase sigma-70 factor [Bacteroidota]|uniref:RNA polymerase sigma-70 factor n=1 Tax=Flectobacillus rivi TaxID=2984209 RepID=A0ABT6YYE4_9BACT|nr:MULTISPECIES: RNA polymerase sigma-70 factor [Bacteroidota]MDI9873889.1 RNA polymerase sigma-70 factor [Flectobacillus rivi]NBB31137.1 RNA polymerase sigma-70 factor [Cellulophaga sp. BC115SP]
MKYNKLTDEQLVNLIIEDNKYAFEEVYHRYWYKLFGVAYHEIGTREEAEELVHDLFESLWNRRHQLNIRMLSAYLVVSIKHLSTNYIKSQITNRKFQEYLIFNEIRQSHATEEVVHFSELSDAVEEAMKKLPEKTCEVFRMSRFENQSVKEIAVQLNLSEKAVEYHITKSLKLLRENLKAYQQT